MATKVKCDHAVMITNGIRCLHCGDIHKLVMPMPIDELSSIGESFAKRHKNCKKQWKQPVANPEWDFVTRVKFWLDHGKRGSSSEAMYNMFMPDNKLLGVDVSSHPRDPSDFRRCYLLLKTVPEFKHKLCLMKYASTIWERLVDNWDKLTTMLEEAMMHPDDISNAKDMFDFMKELGC